MHLLRSGKVIHLDDPVPFCAVLCCVSATKLQCSEVSQTRTIAEIESIPYEGNYEMINVFSINALHF